MTRKQGAIPTSAMIVPAAAGPRMREQWTTTRFSATALSTRSAPTISTTNDCRDGLSIARIDAADQHQHQHHPRLGRAGGGQREQRQRRDHQRQLRVGQQRAASDRRSASSPPQAPNSRIGRNCRPAVSPTDDAGPGQLHHQPHLADDLHPVAGDRDRPGRRSSGGSWERCSEEKVRASGGAHSAPSSSIRSRMPAARSSAARSSAAQAVEPLSEVGVLAVAHGGQQRVAGVGGGDQRRSGGRRDRRCARPGPPPPAARARASRSAAGSARARRARTASAARGSRSWPARRPGSG